LVECPVEDVFFGGSRGGGKTYGLLLDAAYREQKWGAAFRGILFRRSYPELEEVVVKGKEILLPLGAKFNAGSFTFNWPSGAFLRLRHLDKDQDVDKYQGHEYSWQGFDELQNWPSPVGVDKLWATLRSAAGIPVVRRSTGNPGGAGHQWVFDRYIRAGAMKVQRFVPENLRVLGLGNEVQRVWIPAGLDDNLLLLENDPGYEARLAQAGGPKLFRAWRYGDWTAIEGAFFPFDRARHVREARGFIIPPWSPRWVSIDWGYDHYSAIQWHTWIEEIGKYVTYRELSLRQKNSEEIAEAIVRRTRQEGEVLDEIILSFDAFGRKQDDQTIEKRMTAVFTAADFPAPRMSTRKREQGAALLRDYLLRDRWVILDTCVGLIEILPVLVHDPDNVNDVLKVDGDDHYDSARYGLATREKVQKRKPWEVFAEERVKLTNVDGSATDPIQREIEMKRAIREYLAEADEGQ
jgi:hypothetical protein